MISDKLMRERLLILLTLDSKDLYNRITVRKVEYLEILSLRRTRDHFKKIFFSRFPELTFQDLKILSDDLILALHAFYDHIEKMAWYFYATKDMPSAIEERCEKFIKVLSTQYATLTLYLEGESEKTLEVDEE